MRWSLSYIPTLRETPTEAEITSHRLMLRAGLIRKLTAGTYSYLPLGFRSLLKVIRIVREEMTRAGALEVLLPALQPADLWKRSGRYPQMGREMIRFKDRHDKEMVLGPTHEEVITALVAGELRSYRDLPKTLYQIQTKFRDEPRPRFGVIRSCEFIMKDAYSFDRDQTGLNINYQRMVDAYVRIFTRCGLSVIAVEAETGVMGGEDSHEFMVLAEKGEDTVVRCSACSYAASKGRAGIGVPILHHPVSIEDPRQLKEVDTPGVSSVENVSRLLKIRSTQLIKTLLYQNQAGQTIAALVRGDHEVNEEKLRRAIKADRLQMADPSTIQRVTGATVGFSGPVGLKGVLIVADRNVMNLINAVSGANQTDKHLLNVNPGRDFQPNMVADIRYALAGDPCPQCGKAVEVLSAIEVGHVFQLGTKYTAALGATILDQDGKQKPLIMGCYGIGVTRVLAAVIESHYDAAGICWPWSIAPYPVVIVPINQEDASVRDSAEMLYREALDSGLEVLLDDRSVSGGVKLKDADLVGFPARILLSDKSLQKDSVELKLRNDPKPAFIPRSEAVPSLKKLLDRELEPLR